MKKNKNKKKEERRGGRGGGEGTYPNRDPQREHERKDDNVRHNVVSRERDDAKVASTQAKQLKRPPLKRRHQDAREAKREILCMSNNRQHTYVHTLEKNRSTKKTRERERERKRTKRVVVPLISVQHFRSLPPRPPMHPQHAFTALGAAPFASTPAPTASASVSPVDPVPNAASFHVLSAHSAGHVAAACGANNRT